MKQKLVFLILLMFLYTYGLRIDRVILSTDTNNNYLEFWPIAAKAWKEIVGIRPTLALIAPAENAIDCSYGDVIRFDPIPGISTAFQAQVIRLLLPAYFEHEVCIISDIDMLPLNKKYFVDSIKNYSQDTFIIYKNKAYTSQEKRYPMCYIAAQGNLFKEIFHINSLEDIRSTIIKWHEMGLGWDTDELMLYEYLNNWSRFDTQCVLLGHCVERRIDRSNWSYEKKLLENFHYIDAHCPRPYSQYQHEIDTMLNTVLENQCQKILHIPGRFLENADYGTHMVPLLTAVIHTTGPILEMGCGDYSTPLLHALCSLNQRTLLSTDTDREWINNFIDLKNRWHSLVYVPVYEDDKTLNPRPALWDLIGNDQRWSVVLIDHRPGERRVEDINRLRPFTEIFVIHDTQQPSYGYEPLINTFKYRYVYPRYTTQTTLVSDSIDISKFFEA